MKSDRQILKELLETGQLTEPELLAFSQMFEKLEASPIYHILSQKQRAWANQVHERLGLDPGTENLVSSGVVKPTPAERRSLSTFLDSLGPKVLTPPGRAPRR